CDVRVEGRRRAGYTRAVRRWAWVPAVLGSAWAFASAFPPTSWRALAWVALAPLFSTLRAGSARRALLPSWLWAIVMAYLLCDWLPRGLAVFYEQPAIVGLLFFVGIATVTAAVYYMAFALAYRALSRRMTGVLLPVFTAAAWAATEIARGRLLTG